MQHEHSHWDQVGVTQVVNEAADVAIVASIDTIHFPILDNEKKKTHVVKRKLACLTFSGTITNR